MSGVIRPVLASVGFGFVDWIKDASVRPRHCVVPVAIEVKDVDSALDIERVARGRWCVLKILGIFKNKNCRVVNL